MEGRGWCKLDLERRWTWSSVGQRSGCPRLIRFLAMDCTTLLNMQNLSIWGFHLEMVRVLSQQLLGAVQLQVEEVQDAPRLFTFQATSSSSSICRRIALAV